MSQSGQDGSQLVQGSTNFKTASCSGIEDGGGCRRINDTIGAQSSSGSQVKTSYCFGSGKDAGECEIVLFRDSTFDDPKQAETGQAVLKAAEKRLSKREPGRL
jgi:hypothetical protein